MKKMDELKREEDVWGSSVRRPQGADVRLKGPILDTGSGTYIWANTLRRGIRIVNDIPQNEDNTEESGMEEKPKLI